MTDTPECLTTKERHDLMVGCFERLIQAHTKATLALFLAAMIGRSGNTRAEVAAFEADVEKRLQEWAEIGREYNAAKRFHAQVAALEKGRQKTRGRGRRKA